MGPEVGGRGSRGGWGLPASLGRPAEAHLVAVSQASSWQEWGVMVVQAGPETDSSPSDPKSDCEPLPAADCSAVESPSPHWTGCHSWVLCSWALHWPVLQTLTELELLLELLLPLPQEVPCSLWSALPVADPVTPSVAEPEEGTAAVTSVSLGQGVELHCTSLPAVVAGGK